jgi:hypothetical protein
MTRISSAKTPSIASVAVTPNIGGMTFVNFGQPHRLQRRVRRAR